MKFIKKILKTIYQIIFSILEILSQLFPDTSWGNKVRGGMFKIFFKKCGKNIQISKRVRLINPENIEIGNDVYLGYGSWIHGQGHIKIEDEAMLGPYVCLVTGNHTKIKNSYRFGEHSKQPILIRKGCWIGAHSIILPGSIIEDGCLIAAGGIVTKNSLTEKDGKYVGMPIKKI